MTVHTLAQGTRTSSLTMSTLASATYIASSAIDLSATIPVDVTIEVECLPSTTTTGNKQLKVFVQTSLDNTNFTTGPVSGTTITDEADLIFIGSVPCGTTATHRGMFSLRGVPVARYIKIVVFNDMGIALTSGTAYIAAITGVST